MPIVAVNLPMQDSRIERKAGQRFQVKLAVLDQDSFSPITICAGSASIRTPAGK